jgi:hypothetical protein
MAIQITNNGASIKIVNGSQVRHIMKQQIVELEIVKTNILRIDIGKGALGNVYIPQPEVTLPVVTTPEELKDAVNDMLQSVTAGSATEAKQIEQITKLNDLNSGINLLKQSMQNVDNKLFFEPTYVDESNPNTIYKGFAVAGSATGDAVWAIQKVVVIGDVCNYLWADGNRNFDNVWENRTNLTYA